MNTKSRGKYSLDTQFNGMRWVQALYGPSGYSCGPTSMSHQAHRISLPWIYSHNVTIRMLTVRIKVPKRHQSECAITDHSLLTSLD